MIDATPLLRCCAGFRARRLLRENTVTVQQQMLKRLIQRAAATRFGRDHGFARHRDRGDFAASVPLRCYENKVPRVIADPGLFANLRAFAAANRAD